MHPLKKYIDKFNHLIQISHSYNNHLLTSELQDEIYKLNENQFYIAVIGQIKRGKSTLINSLIGRSLLPTAVLPLTSIITMIRFGSETKARVLFNDCKELFISQQELKDYITESGNPNNSKNVNYVEITCPSEFLNRGIVLIDTPGIGSLFLHNTKSTKDFIPKIDAGIFVLSVDPPITKTEFDFLSEVYSKVNNLFFVINKIDLINEKDLNEIILYTSNMISEHNHSLKQEIYPLSSLSALEGRIINDRKKLTESRILNLEEKITKLIENNKIQVLESNLNRKMKTYVSQLNFSLELQLKSLQTPVNVFKEKIKEFNDEIDRISKEKILILHQFTEQITELINRIDLEVESFGINNRKLFYESLQNFLNTSVNTKKIKMVRSSREFLRDMLTHKFENWRLNFEQKIYNEFSLIVSESVGKINELIQQISRLSSGLFNISAPLYFEELNIKLPSEFFYYTEDPALFLEVDFLKISSVLLPQKFLSKLILKKMEKGIDEKLMINSGKIQSFYKSLVSDHSSEFSRSMNNKISQILLYTNNIILNAQKSKETNELAIEPKMKKILDDIYLLKSLN